MSITTRLIGGAGLVAGLAMLTATAEAGRFGGGGFRGGGAVGGGFAGGAVRAGGFSGGRARLRPPAAMPAARPAATFQGGSVARGAVHGPYGGTVAGGRQTAAVARPGGAGIATRQAGAYTGPRGGVALGGGRAGSFTGAGGTTISGGAHGGAYTGPRGTQVIAGGRGGSVTGPGGNTASAGRGGAVVIGPNGNVHATGGQGAAVTGPGGRAIAGGSHGSVTVGPGGAVASGGRGAIATGPGGTIAGGSRGAIATGMGGTIAAGSRGAIAVGPHGAVAGGNRAVVAHGASGYWAAGTRYRAAADIRGQGYYVRSGFRYYNAFNPGWYARYPRAWVGRGWIAGSAWTAATWAACATAVGYAATAPAYVYDYGDNITFQDGTVYFGDQPDVTEVQYADQAAQIAAAGQQAQPPADDTWQALGVFAMVRGDETTSNDIYQLALNKDGVVRGNYYNAVTDAVTPLSGSLDKKSQRVAWTVGDAKDTVYEAGLLNLTKEETTMLVHHGKDGTEQFTLVRVEQPAQGQGGQP